MSQTAPFFTHILRLASNRNGGTFDLTPAVGETELDPDPPGEEPCSRGGGLGGAQAAARGRQHVAVLLPS